LLELMMNSPSDTLVLKADDLGETFFDLRSGVAGDLLQKVSNYRMRLVILGDFTQMESRSLRDFIYECNKFGRVIFGESLEKAIAMLK
jgi:hypothetical protein